MNKHSGGPRTPEGKDRSRRNAVKHGLRASDNILLSGLKSADRATFDRLREALTCDYHPQTNQEKMIVELIVVQHFRLFRLYNIEQSAADSCRRFPLARESIIPHLDRFARYDANITRQIRNLHNRLCSLYRSRGDFSLNSFNGKE